MSREAMQMALEALELYQSKSSVQMFDDAVKALRQALETEQEPVAWRYKISPPFWTYSEKYPNKEFAGDAWDKWQVTPLYTALPKREWVGLTDEEIQDLSFSSEKFDASNSEWFDRWGFARAIEAKLKEKNGGEYRNVATTERTKLKEKNQ